MKSLKLRFTPEAAKLLSKFHSETKKHLNKAFQEIRKNPYVGHDLQKELSGLKSYKSKKYRILYNINEDEHVIEIYYTGHRKDIYEQFRRLLNQLIR